MAKDRIQFALPMEDFILEEFIEVDNKNSIQVLDKKIKINETKIKRYKERVSKQE